MLIPANKFYGMVLLSLLHAEDTDFKYRGTIYKTNYKNSPKKRSGIYNFSALRLHKAFVSLNITLYSKRLNAGKGEFQHRKKKKH